MSLSPTLQRMVNWGDVPTWATAGVAFLALIAGALAYRTQSEQLRLQRTQLADQTRVQEREQANQVEVLWQNIDPAALLLPDEFADVVGMLVVVNNSKRPIRIVACKRGLTPTDGEPGPVRLADVCGELRPYPPGRLEDTLLVTGESMVPLIKAGTKAGFVWSPANESGSGIDFFRMWVRFTDDASLHWQIDTTLHLEKLARRDW